MLDKPHNTATITVYVQDFGRNIRKRIFINPDGDYSSELGISSSDSISQTLPDTISDHDLDQIFSMLRGDTSRNISSLFSDDVVETLTIREFSVLKELLRNGNRSVQISNGNASVSMENNSISLYIERKNETDYIDITPTRLSGHTRQKTSGNQCSLVMDKGMLYGSYVNEVIRALTNE